MSTKQGDDDDDENEDFVEDEYDDDEDEEDDFRPGVDDGDEDDDEEYDDEEENELDDDRDVSFLDGVLLYDEGQKIHYKGNGFHLESVEPISCNILDRNSKSTPGNMITIEMVGPCDVSNGESSGRKPTPRKIQLTFAVADPNHELVKKNLKGDANHDDDDDDGEKKPSIYFQVYGSEIGNPDHGIEFKGGFVPLPGGKEINLLCQVRTSNSAKTIATPNTTAAAAAVEKRRNDNDDNIDDVDEDGIDYNELIALREEALLPFEALKKRYRDCGPVTDDPNGEDEVDHAKKKSYNGKHKHKNDKTDDDDDDIEF
jgi:hypothetical protein